MAAKKSKKSAIKAEPKPEPGMKIGAIAANGTIPVNFNQDMIAPSAINQRVYQKVFQFGVKSNTDGSMKYGKIMKKSVAERRLRLLKAAGKGESKEADMLKFSVEVTGHDPTKLEMRMNFMTPGAVSSGNENDNVEMKVMEVSLFKSADLKPMSIDSFKNGDAQIDKTMPPMISDEKAAANIGDTTE